MRSEILLALTSTLLLSTACGLGTSNDDAAVPGSETGTGDDPGSDDLVGPDTTTGATTVAETTEAPTTGDPTTGGPTTGDPTTGDPTGDDTDASTGTTGETGQPQPPTNGAELLPWLEAGEYLEWTAESGVHPSSGPHGGGVRTFVNDVLLTSLEAGGASHPQGAAAIKELYGGGGTVIGWAVEVKLQPDSAGGSGWYWYEIFGTDVYADGTGEALCTGCHVGGNDYVLTPFPLQ